MLAYRPAQERRACLPSPLPHTPPGTLAYHRLLANRTCSQDAPHPQLFHPPCSPCAPAGWPPWFSICPAASAPGEPRAGQDLPCLTKVACCNLCERQISSRQRQLDPNSSANIRGRSPSKSHLSNISSRTRRQFRFCTARCTPLVNTRARLGQAALHQVSWTTMTNTIVATSIDIR